MTYYCFAETIYASHNSTLYLAFNKEQTQEVIFKCFEADAQAMYLREMSSFGIEHPNLVPCLDTFYLQDGRPCVMYEFFQKGTLEDWLSKYQRANIDFCYRFLEDILNALIYLHTQNRIHCDIKPANIFLRQQSQDIPLFVLGDLGATCSLREAQESRYGVGTPSYIAPERLYDNFFYNSDLYSLGVVAFELLAGERLFSGTPEEIKRAHLSKQPNLEALFQSPLYCFIEKLLEKDPKLRIANAQTALKLLIAIKTGKSVTLSGFKTPPAKIPGPVLEQIIPQSFKLHYQFDTNATNKKLLAFEVEKKLLIGLEFAEHIDLIDPENQKNDIILKSGTAQSNNLNDFFYTNTSKLYQFNLSLHQAQCVYSFHKSISYFHIHNQYLLLRDKYHTFYHHLDDDKVFKFSQAHYFSAPVACIFDNGCFCLTGGSHNQQLFLRDNHASELMTWDLKGPIIALSRAKNTVLALSLDIQNSQQHWLYVLDTQTPYNKQAIGLEVSQYCLSENHIFWLNKTNKLCMSTTDLKLQLIAQLPKDLHIKSFQLTANHHWVVVFSSNSENIYHISCFKASGE